MKRLIFGAFLTCFFAMPTVTRAQDEFDATQVRQTTDDGCQFYLILAFAANFLDEGQKHVWHWAPYRGVGCKNGELISGSGILTDHKANFLAGKFVDGFLGGTIGFYVQSNGRPSQTAEAKLIFHTGCPDEAPKCVEGRGVNEASANTGTAGLDRSPAAIERRIWANCATQIKEAFDLRANVPSPMPRDSIQAYFNSAADFWANDPDSSVRWRVEYWRVGAAVGSNPINVRFNACLAGERLGPEATRVIIDAMQRTSESLAIERRMRSECVSEIDAATQWSQSLTPPRTANFDAIFRANSSYPDSTARRIRKSLRAREAGEGLPPLSRLSLCMINSRLGPEEPQQANRSPAAPPGQVRYADSPGDSPQLSDLLSSCSELIEPSVAQQVAIGSNRNTEIGLIRDLASVFTSMVASEITREVQRWAEFDVHDPVSELRRCLQNRRQAQTNGSVPGLAAVARSSMNSGQPTPPVRVAPPAARTEAPSPSPTSQTMRTNPTPDANDNYKFAVPFVPNCATYKQLPRKLGYDAYQMTNTCNFGIIGKVDFYFSGERYYNNDGGFGLLPGKSDRHSFLNISPRLPWSVSYSTCPDRAEMTRRTGRRVATVTFAKDGSCFGVFEPNPQGIIK